MKKTVFINVIIVLLFSCASFPKPENDSESLIIGSVVWDFPDGLFGDPPAKFVNNIKLYFVNVATSQSFQVSTSDGYFAFKCNGKDQFLLQYAYLRENTPDPKYGYRWSYQLNLRIDTKPNCVMYVGNITITSSNPEIVKGDVGNSVIQTWWRFRERYQLEYNANDLRNYLESIDKDKAWKNHKILNLDEI